MPASRHPVISRTSISLLSPPMAHLLNKFCFLIPKQASGNLDKLPNACLFFLFSILPSAS